MDDDDYGSGRPAPHIEPIPQAEAEAAVRALIRWAGDDPTREGLLETPARVARAYREYFRGYQEDPGLHLSKTFGEVGGYDEIVILRDIPFQSHCEHHMAPIIGKAHIAYLPRKRVQKHLDPLGVAVVIEATHACMSARGVMTAGVTMTTSRMMGVFRDDDRSRKEVLALMGKG
jgi:GTP cyclohydrolase IA